MSIHEWLSSMYFPSGKIARSTSAFIANLRVTSKKQGRQKSSLGIRDLKNPTAPNFFRLSPAFWLHQAGDEREEDAAIAFHNFPCHRSDVSHRDTVQNSAGFCLVDLTQLAVQ